MSERKRHPTTRFALERTKGPYLVPEGAFESALIVVKDVFRDDTLGISDTSYWSQFEKKATMTPKETCFQYFLAGRGHKSLASILLNHFESYRSGVQTGEISVEVQKEMLGRLSSELYKHFPRKYRKSIPR